MTRILQRPDFGESPVNVPAPPAWDAGALSAYEQGYAEGVQAGRDAGRLDLLIVGGQVDRCVDVINASSRAMNARVIEVAELFVTTALRHIPEARTAGLLVRLGEVLATFDPGPMTLALHPDDVEQATDAVQTRSTYARFVTVVSDNSLQPGEFRLSSEWADAEATFDRYLSAAREALELHLSGDGQ